MLQAKNLASNTIRSYLTYIRPYLSYLQDRDLSPDNVSGRPIVMEITPEDAEDFYSDQVIGEVEAKKPRAKHEAALRGNIFYRVPAICTVRLIDGQDLILKSRMPVYQKGEDLTFPVHVLVK